MEGKNDKPTEKFWMPWTIENLCEMASSRILQVCALIDHHKDQAAQPLFFHRDGTRDHDQEAANPCMPAQAPRKFLILIVYEEQRTIMKHVSILGHPYPANADTQFRYSSFGGRNALSTTGECHPRLERKW